MKNIFRKPVLAVLIAITLILAVAGGAYAAFVPQSLTGQGTITVSDPYAGSYSTMNLVFPSTTIWQDKPLSLTADTVFTNSGEYPVVGFTIYDVTGVPTGMTFTVPSPLTPVDPSETTTIIFQVTASANGLSIGEHPINISCKILPFCIDFATGLTASTATVTGDLASGFIIQTDNNPATYHVLDTVGLTATPALSPAYHAFYLESYTSDLTAYFHDKWTGVAMLAQIDAQIAGVAPFFYIKDGHLIDGFQYAFGDTDEPLVINGDYPTGIYVYEGLITDVNGATRTITVAMEVTR